MAFPSMSLLLWGNQALGYLPIDLLSFGEENGVAVFKVPLLEIVLNSLLLGIHASHRGNCVYVCTFLRGSLIQQS